MTPKKKAGEADAEKTPVVPAAPWAEDEWEGRTLYRCRYCQKDSFDRAEIEAHVRYAHRAR